MSDLELELEEVPSIDLEFSDIKLIDAVYYGGESDNIIVSTDNENRIITATLKQVQYESKDNFPEVGSDKLIYVDLSDNSLWVYKNGEYVSASSSLKIDSEDWVSLEGETSKEVKTIKFGYEFSVTFPDEKKESVVSLSPIYKKSVTDYIDNNFVKKQTPEFDEGTTRGYVYYIDTDQNQTVKKVQIQANPDTIPLRNHNGTFYVGDATLKHEAVNKGYVDDKFNGASKAITYDTYVQMIEVLNGMSATDINRGQDIMIVQTGIPDLWVAYVEETSVPYTYIDDETFINELLTDGTVQVGYFKLAYLETQKIDFEEYAKKTDLIDYINALIDDSETIVKMTDGTKLSLHLSENIVNKLSNTLVIPTSTPSSTELVAVDSNGNQTMVEIGNNLTLENGKLNATGGGLNIADLPKFTNKLYINMANATSLAGVLTLPIVSSSNFVVDWGDGTTTDYVEATTSITHTYSNASFSGWVYIYGDWKGIVFGSASNANKSTIIKVEYDNSVTSIGSYAFYNCSGLKSITIPNSVTSIGSSAFDGCSGLTSITIPDSVTSIGSSAFNGCTSLNSINIPNGVTSIGNSVFSGCSGLTSVTIPASVTRIGVNAFLNCSKLTEITIKAKTPPTLDDTNAIPSNVTQIFVPYSSLRAYKTATNWSLFADKIYPKGGNYSETITIPTSSWDTSTNTVTVEAVGSTTEARNIITWNVSSGGVQVENTYGLKCTVQGTMSLTFSCETIPTEDIEVSVRYMLTNY